MRPRASTITSFSSWFTGRAAAVTRDAYEDMASESFESLDMEFWSDWDEDVDIPSPLRIVKRPSAATNTDTGPNSGENHIPRRLSSVPSALRIVKRPNTITKTHTETKSEEIHIPRRLSSISNCVCSSPPEHEGGCLTIHKRRKPRSVVPQESFRDSSPDNKEHVTDENNRGCAREEVQSSITSTKQLNSPKLNQEDEARVLEVGVHKSKWIKHWLSEL